MSKKDKDLTAFGNYLLSDDREDTLFYRPDPVYPDDPVCHTSNVVYHSDIENWKALQEKGK